MVQSGWRSCMRKAFIPGVFLLLITAAAPQAAQRRGAATGPVTFAVLVSDPSGAPIADARVTLSGPAQRNGRTEAGRIVFEDLPAGAYRFHFEKDGFVPVDRDVTGRSRVPIDVKVTLDRVPPPPPPPVTAIPPPTVTAKPIALDLP